MTNRRRHFLNSLVTRVAIIDTVDVATTQNLVDKVRATAAPVRTLTICRDETALHVARTVIDPDRQDVVQLAATDADAIQAVQNCLAMADTPYIQFVHGIVQDVPDSMRFAADLLVDCKADGLIGITAMGAPAGWRFPSSDLASLATLPTAIHAMLMSDALLVRKERLQQVVGAGAGPLPPATMLAEAVTREGHFLRSGLVLAGVSATRRAAHAATTVPGIFNGDDRSRLIATVRGWVDGDVDPVAAMAEVRALAALVLPAGGSDQLVPLWLAIMDAARLWVTDHFSHTPEQRLALAIALAYRVDPTLAGTLADLLATSLPGLPALTVVAEPDVAIWRARCAAAFAEVDDVRVHLRNTQMTNRVLRDRLVKASQ